MAKITVFSKKPPKKDIKRSKSIEVYYLMSRQKEYAVTIRGCTISRVARYCNEHMGTATVVPPPLQQGDVGGFLVFLGVRILGRWERCCKFAG